MLGRQGFGIALIWLYFDMHSMLTWQKTWYTICMEGIIEYVKQIEGTVLVSKDQFDIVNDI